MTVEDLAGPEWDSYIEFLTSEFNLRGLLLHGSFAKGLADEWSDIDLIGITQHGGLKNYKGRFQEREVELCMGSAELMVMAFNSLNVKNNNLFANAFQVGVVVRDEGEVFERLKISSTQAWTLGPIPISQSEFGALSKRLRKGIARAQHNVWRNKSSLDENLNRVYTDLIFEKMVYAFVRAANLWASSLSETLVFLSKSAPVFRRECESYLESVDQQARVSSLQELYKLFLASGPLSLGMEPPLTVQADAEAHA